MNRQTPRRPVKAEPWQYTQFFGLVSITLLSILCVGMLIIIGAWGVLLFENNLLALGFFVLFYLLLVIATIYWLPRFFRYLRVRKRLGKIVHQQKGPGWKKKLKKLFHPLRNITTTEIAVVTFIFLFIGTIIRQVIPEVKQGIASWQNSSEKKMGPSPRPKKEDKKENSEVRYVSYTTASKTSGTAPAFKDFTPDKDNFVLFEKGVKYWYRRGTLGIKMIPDRFPLTVTFERYDRSDIYTTSSWDERGNVQFDLSHDDGSGDVPWYFTVSETVKLKVWY